MATLIVPIPSTAHSSLDHVLIPFVVVFEIIRPQVACNKSNELGGHPDHVAIFSNQCGVLVPSPPIIVVVIVDNLHLMSNAEAVIVASVFVVIRFLNFLAPQEESVIGSVAM